MSGLLRPWDVSDAVHLHHALTLNGDLQTQFGDVDLSSVEACERFIVESLSATDPTARHFALQADDFVVGSVGISHIDSRHDTAWVSYWLSASARGQGLATGALVAAATWAFESGIFRLELGHRVNSPASCRVATRADFAPEGVERAKLRYGQERFDVETHARLATDTAPAQIPLPIAS